MENKDDIKKKQNLSNNKIQKIKNCLPIIGLMFGLSPIILLLLSWIPFLGYFFGYLFFYTWWGIYFQILGLIMGIIALCIGRNFSNAKSIFFSIIAILCPFIWCFVIYILYNYAGVEIWL